jgi:hypothetical protein
VGFKNIGNYSVFISIEYAQLNLADCINAIKNRRWCLPRAVLFLGVGDALAFVQRIL